LDASRDEAQRRSFDSSHNRACLLIGDLCGGQVPKDVIREATKQSDLTVIIVLRRCVSLKNLVGVSQGATSFVELSLD
jgi:hypothetical protein